MASIEITMRHSDVRIEALKDYAQQRMEKLCAAYPKVTKVTCVIDIDVKKHMYMAEVVANRLGTTAVGAKEFSESAKSVIDTAAARAERQLLKMRVKARKGNVRQDTCRHQVHPARVRRGGAGASQALSGGGCGA